MRDEVAVAFVRLTRFAKDDRAAIERPGAPRLLSALYSREDRQGGNSGNCKRSNRSSRLAARGCFLADLPILGRFRENPHR